MPRNPDKTDYSKGFPEGFEVFASLCDPRDGGHTLHHFGEILFIAFAGVLCGVRSYELMEGREPARSADPTLSGQRLKSKSARSRRIRDSRQTS